MKNFRVRGKPEANKTDTWWMIIGHLRTTKDISAMFTIPKKKEQSNFSCDGIQEVFLGPTYIPQGGLEIPCVLVFEGESKEISKIKKFVNPELEVKS